MPEGIGYGAIKKKPQKRKRLRKLSPREIEENFQGKGKKPKKKAPPKARSDIRRMTDEDLSDLVRRRTKAGVKTEGKKKKKKEPKVSDIYTGHSRDRDINAIKQAHEAQFVRNKANFVTRRTMQKKSELSKHIDGLDIGAVNRVMGSYDRNKATMIKKLLKKRKRK